MGCRFCGGEKPPGNRVYCSAACKHEGQSRRDLEISERRRDTRLKELYGISLARYKEILAAQGGGCAICGAKQKPGAPALSVDHDHKTGALRGILCPRCNERLLTSARDNPEVLEAAAAYLRKEPWGTVPPDKLKTQKRSGSTRYRNAPKWMAPKGAERKF